MLPLHSQNAAVRQHQLKHEKLGFNIKITANATPASKVHTVDLPGVVYLRTEGKVAEADAVETITWTTAADATNAVFGILIDGSELCDQSIRAVKAARVSQVVATGTAITVRAPNNSSTVTAMLTAGGNIAIEVLATGTSLDTETATFFVEVDYELE